jgi:hypothetical protein
MSKNVLPCTAILVIGILATLIFSAGCSGNSNDKAGGTVSGTPVQPAPAGNVPRLVVENMNTGAVNNGATSEPRFTFSTSVEIVSLYDYHWNNGMGDTPGTIAIQNVDTNELYGPFTTYGSPGQGGVPNVYWQTEPGITIPSGTYRIKDSNPSTWSQNSQTGGAGMSQIVYQQTSSTVSPAGTGSPGSALTLTAPQSIPEPVQGSSSTSPDDLIIGTWGIPSSDMQMEFSADGVATLRDPTTGDYDTGSWEKISDGRYRLQSPSGREYPVLLLDPIAGTMYFEDYSMVFIWKGDHP